MRHCLNSLLLTLQRPTCTDNTTDTVTSRKSTTDRRHTASQPDGACKQTHTNTTPRTATASATRHHCAPHGDDDDGTNSPTNLLAAPPPAGTVQKHVSDGARRMEAAINHHAASGQQAAGPTPHNNDEQSCTHPVGGWDGGRSNRRPRERKTCMGAATNENTQRKVRSRSASGLNYMQ